MPRPASRLPDLLARLFAPAFLGWSLLAAGCDDDLAAAACPADLAGSAGSACPEEGRRCEQDACADPCLSCHRIDCTNGKWVVGFYFPGKDCDGGSGEGDGSRE